MFTFKDLTLAADMIESALGLDTEEVEVMLVGDSGEPEGLFICIIESEDKEDAKAHVVIASDLKASFATLKEKCDKEGREIEKVLDLEINTTQVTKDSKDDS